MNKKDLVMLIMAKRTLDYEKDPNPEHWRTISGAKVHLDENGEIDGGAGGNFNGNYWDGKKGQQHVVGPHTMMKKNIGSGATMFNMAAMGAFNNKVEPTKPAEPKPVKKPKTPKTPKEPEFVFPQVVKRTKPQNLKDWQVQSDLKWALWAAEAYNENHAGAQKRIDTLASKIGVPKEELLLPDATDKMAELFGSVFSEANNERKRSFTKTEINKFKELSEALKNADKKIADELLSGINIKTLEMTPEKAYDEWKQRVTALQRIQNELKGGVSSDFEQWKKATKGKTKKERKNDYDKEKRLFETPELLKAQAKTYKPDSVVGVAKGPDMTFDEADHNRANPGYRKIWDTDYKEGYRVNCQTCVVAFEMRMRGYNVEALPQNNWNNPFQEDVASWHSMTNTGGQTLAWIRPDGTHPQPNLCRVRNGEEAYKWLGENTKDGERYTMSVAWRDGGAHIFTITKVNGKVILFDPQTGIQYNDEESIRREYLDKTSYVRRSPRLLRIDDCAPNMFYVNRMLKAAK